MNRFIFNSEPSKPRPLMIGDKIWWVEDRSQYIGKITGQHRDMEHDDWEISLTSGAYTRLYKGTPNIHRFDL